MPEADSSSIFNIPCSVIDNCIESNDSLVVSYELSIKSYFIRNSYFVKKDIAPNDTKIMSGTIIQLDGKPNTKNEFTDHKASRVFIEFNENFHHDTLVYTKDTFYYIFMNYKEMPTVLETLKNGEGEPKINIRAYKSGNVMAELYRKFTIKTE